MGLTKLGHDVTVVTSYDPNRKTTEDNVKVVQFKAGGRWNPRTILNPFKKVFYGDIKGYREYLANFSGEVIMFHTTTLWNTDTVLDILPKIPAKTILISHGVSFNSGSFIRRMAWKPYVWRLYKIYNTFDHVVFLSDKCDKNRFMDKYIMERRKFNRWSVIPNGAPYELFRDELPDFRQAYQITLQQKILLYVAAYSPQKNQDMALNAFLKSEHNNTVLVFIGNKLNDYSKILQNKVKLLKNIAGRVLILAGLKREMIFAAYKAADLFLHPSKTEVQPLVVLDAMASGTPFISTYVGCVSDLPGGVVVETMNEMSESLWDLLHNPKKYNKLKIQGLKACNEIYNWDHVSKEYDDLIQKICSG